jgi:hypothetical protein
VNERSFAPGGANGAAVARPPRAPRDGDMPAHIGDTVIQTYDGSCFCGAVGITVTGEPVAAGFCHCSSCRSWAAAPVNAFTLWKPEAVKITKGAQGIGVYHKTEKSYRKFCKLCGGHVLTDHPLWGLIDVYAATIPTYRYEPTLHVNYAEAVLRIKDGLPKMKDLPKEMGGSGEVLPD